MEHLPVYLHVAEKPDAAKKIAGILSNNTNTRRAGFSQYNAIFEFVYNLRGRNIKMIVTSVTGHLMETDLDEKYRGWQSIDPVHIFDPNVVAVVKSVSKTSENIAKTLTQEARQCNTLVLWLDCDREGENISFEVIQVCKKANSNLDLNRNNILRAKFSEFTPRAIKNAMDNLGKPNQNDSLAVEARQEIDLRIGAAFTRFQTLRLKAKFDGLPEKVISYGPCQFPTLGFVVERFLQIKNFIPEKFWSIDCGYKEEKASAEFLWKRNRLFDRLACLIFYETLLANPTATVTNISKRETRKRKPIPLNTVELQKICARQLHMSAQKTMTTAEALYNKGYISYPRTETDLYNLSDEELKVIIKEQTPDAQYGNYAQQLLDGNQYVRPVQGKHNDNAHPPIHPTKYTNSDFANQDERQLYELICRHFLASCSKDAIGFETIVTICIASTEEFTTRGLMISEYNYLQVYTYEKWSNHSIPLFQLHQQFIPTKLIMREGQTSPPSLLAEADLISLMDKNGIGTDATIATHIQTIQERGYAKKNGSYFEPTNLGISLVKAYDKMGYELSKPNLRAKMEQDMKRISDGLDSKDHVLVSNLQMYKSVFISVNRKVQVLDQVVSNYFPMIGSDPQSTVTIQAQYVKCGKCEQFMDLKSTNQEEGTKFLACDTCQQSYTLPDHCSEITPVTTSENENEPFCCPICQFQIVKLVKENSNTSFTLCPYCFRNPPIADLENINETFASGFKCINCKRTDCKYSKSLSSNESAISIRKCPLCKQNDMTLRLTRNGKPFIGCNGYKSGCKAVIWMDIEKATVITDEFCTHCTEQTRLLQVQFKANQLPPTFDVHMKLCIFCVDQQLPNLPSGIFNFSISTATTTNNTNTTVQRYPQQQQQQSFSNSYPQQQQQHRNIPQQRSIPPMINRNTSNGASGVPPNCHCALAASEFVCKNGPNTGKHYWKCSVKQCEFFQWA